MSTAVQALPIRYWASGQYWPDIWDTSPIAFSLDDAFRGFPGNQAWTQAALKTRDEVGIGGAPSPH